jgi:rhamnose transport system permease protein
MRIQQALVEKQRNHRASPDFRQRFVGALIGLLIARFNVLPLINVSPFWQQAIQGIVILAAVLTSVLVKRNNQRLALRRRAI